MKTAMKRIILLTMALVLALAHTAFAEETDPVKGVYNALMAAGSAYSEDKASFRDFYPNIQFGEQLDGEGFTLSISGAEDMDGTWTFVREGDYLTLTAKETDFTAQTMSMAVLRAVGDYYGMNNSLLNAYISGLEALAMENPYYKNEIDGAAGTVRISIYIAGPYEMKELDQMVLTEDVLNMYDYGPLTAESTSRSAALGKVNLLISGTKDDVTLLLAEYGELDDVAYQDLINVAKTLKPDGWETFVAEYTELKDAETPGYVVFLNMDETTVSEIIDPLQGYSYAIAHFGAGTPVEEPEPEEPAGEPAETPAEETPAAETPAEETPAE